MMSPHESWLLLPRPDIRDEENCYTCVAPGTHEVYGFVQVFRDGSAGYWRNRGDQALRANNETEACRALVRMGPVPR